jgi:hypothetical protein
LVTSRQLERLFQHNKGTEDSQIVIDELQRNNLFYKKYDFKMKIFIAVVVLLTEFFQWIPHIVSTWTWITVGIIFGLIELALALGILCLMI